MRHVVPYVFPLIEREILISFRRELGENDNRARFIFFQRERVCVCFVVTLGVVEGGIFECIEMFIYFLCHREILISVRIELSENDYRARFSFTSRD